MTKKFAILHVVGVADLSRKKAGHEPRGILVAANDQSRNIRLPDIDIVVNLTYPMAHYQVSREALLAGKHVWSEKMMAVTLEEADELTALAKEKNRILAIAPDTFLGGGLQTCRYLIDQGLIGQPIMTQAVIARGSLLISTDPENKKMTLSPGGGIPFDMGGYYLTALTAILGPVKRVAGVAQLHSRKFCHVENPRFNEEIALKTPTNVVGMLEFDCGVLGSIAMESESFQETSRLEIYGTEGTLIGPDPNRFGGPVKIIRKNNTSLDPYEFPLTHGYSEGCNRGIGVADLAWSLANKRPHRATLATMCLKLFMESGNPV